MPTQCRAGCNQEETMAHVVQRCHRTHGGRVLRYNAVVKIVAAGLKSKGWGVYEELHIRTSLGLRKPDLVCSKDETIVVLHAQVVSGQGMQRAYEDKKNYYNMDEIMDWVKNRFNPEATVTRTEAVTVNWKGVWLKDSMDALLSMGLSIQTLRGVTTRVLQGSHTNWTRYNQMTGRVP